MERKLIKIHSLDYPKILDIQKFKNNSNYNLYYSNSFEDNRNINK